MRFTGTNPGPPHPRPQEPAAQRAGSQARVGRAHGCAPTQDPGRLPSLPCSNPPRKAASARPTRTRTETLESRMIGNNQVRFGEGPTEKDHPGGTSLAAYSTFGCTSSGDVITFVMEREGCSFQEACERLSTRARPPLLEASPRTAPKSTGRRWEELPADSPEAHVLDLAMQVYQAELWRNARAQAYLRVRAVPEDVARTQRLGYT